jgi:hypothetical protein
LSVRISAGENGTRRDVPRRAHQRVTVTAGSGSAGII